MKKLMILVLAMLVFATIAMAQNPTYVPGATGGAVFAGSGERWQRLGDLELG